MNAVAVVVILISCCNKINSGFNNISINSGIVFKLTSSFIY